MSKRSQNIASMFSTRAPETKSIDPGADGETRTPRVASASVRSMRESFSGFERENEELRARIGSGAMIVSIDPALIDPSPVLDRFEDDIDSTAFQALCQAIEERGQEVPVLLRQHPFAQGRYQSAYGHRRIRAARVLGRPVRAMIRVLSDEDLVIAQGMENSTREDLTYIERAVFAAQLEQAGHSRRVIGRSLSIDKAELSKLISVVRAVPPETIRAVGRAPKAGRTRWAKFAEAMSDIYVVSQLRRRQIQPDFQALKSDDRFIDLLRLATRRNTPEKLEHTVLDGRGRRIASLVTTGRDVRLIIDPELGPSFAQYLENRLPGLVNGYRSSILGETPTDSASSDGPGSASQTPRRP